MGHRDPWAARLLVIGLLPGVVLGAVLTVSIFGAIFGVPLLLLVGRPWWAATVAVRRGTAIGAAARRHALVAVVVLTRAFAVSVLIGFDDLDSGTDVLFVALGALDLAACWSGLARATRS